MKEIFIDREIENDGIISGLVFKEKTAYKNLKILYKEYELLSILNKFGESATGGHVFDRFCQFVVYIRFDLVAWEMKITDYHNDIDPVLEEYSLPDKNGWENIDRETIIDVFQDIEDEPDDIGRMIQIK